MSGPPGSAVVRVPYGSHARPLGAGGPRSPLCGAQERASAVARKGTGLTPVSKADF